MESDEILTARTMPHPDRDREPKYCWACGFPIHFVKKGHPYVVFYNEEGKRAFVHVVTMGESWGECYLKARQENTLFEKPPKEAEEAEGRKGMLY